VTHKEALREADSIVKRNSSIDMEAHFKLKEFRRENRARLIEHVRNGPFHPKLGNRWLHIHGCTKCVAAILDNNLMNACAGVSEIVTLYFETGDFKR
jgi:hypothetical protein